MYGIPSFIYTLQLTPFQAKCVPTIPANRADAKQYMSTPYQPYTQTSTPQNMFSAHMEHLLQVSPVTHIMQCRLDTLSKGISELSSFLTMLQGHNKNILLLGCTHLCLTHRNLKHDFKYFWQFAIKFRKIQHD